MRWSLTSLWNYIRSESMLYTINSRNIIKISPKFPIAALQIVHLAVSFVVSHRIQAYNTILVCHASFLLTFEFNWRDKMKSPVFFAILLVLANLFAFINSECCHHTTVYFKYDNGCGIPYSKHRKGVSWIPKNNWSRKIYGFLHHFGIKYFTVSLGGLQALLHWVMWWRCYT